MIKGELIMKEVFMPSMDELYQMQDRGANVYKYILTKAVESLICHGLNYPSEGILKNAYKYLREDPEIARAVCTLYPEEMEFSEVSSYDGILCDRIITKTECNPCGLDNLCRFSSDVVLDHLRLANIIVFLEKELSKNPKYRFEYVGYDSTFFKRGANRLLDDIFGNKITDKELMFMLGDFRGKAIESLIKIEPAYAISLPNCFFFKYSWDETDDKRTEQLYTGINCYADRYGISRNVGSQYYKKDILTNPDQNVKRLIRCINDRK